MVQKYTGNLLRAIQTLFQPQIPDRQLQLVQMVLLLPFLSCQSVRELILTFGLPRDATYKAFDHIRWECIRMAIRRQGFRRLRNHLEKLRRASAATQSREAVTLVTDDSTRETRGESGGISGNFYNGAAGKVTSGINIQVFMAVIGDGKENIILDARIVLPASDGKGRPPKKRSEWFADRTEELDGQLKRNGLSLRKAIASVDSAYATRAVKEVLDRINVAMVSQMHSGRRLSLSLGKNIAVSGKAGGLLKLWFEALKGRLKPLNDEPGAEYLRGIFDSRALGKIVVMARQTEKERKYYFSTDPSMKAISIHRAVVRRWRIERVFWSLKLEIGWKQFHDQGRTKIMTRIFFALIVYQALIDTAQAEKVPTGEIYRTLRRNRHVVVPGIMNGSAFSWGVSSDSVLVQGLAA